MSLAFSVLGSGSSGNSTLLSFARNGSIRNILVDSGLSIRATSRRLAAHGVELDSITDILLTHLDIDHFYRGWINAIEKYDITVRVHSRHEAFARRLGVTRNRLRTFTHTFGLHDCVTVRTLHFEHDASGTIGFIFDDDSVRFGIATDLGHVPGTMFEHYTNLDAIAIESNYDRRLQMESDRPTFLKQRIMGGGGHLSNEQSLAAVREIAGRSDLQHVVAMHLSRQCNDPELVRKLYAKHAPELKSRLVLSSQARPTPLLSVRRRPSNAHHDKVTVATNASETLFDRHAGFAVG